MVRNLRHIGQPLVKEAAAYSASAVAISARFYRNQLLRVKLGGEIGR
ncbi:hypothetical protein KCP69_04695 [Salmonella enterica subsp. enterica]|nr:hypothetical protein KCP69_04695 [Salmonella enterica subsp. enterica]